MKSRILRCLMAFLAAAVPQAMMYAQETGRLTGIAFDSVLKQPMAQVQVWIPGTTIAAISDFKGKFELLGVPVGKQTIAYSSLVLDSIGVGSRALEVDVSATENAPLHLGAPSAALLWRKLCEDKPRVGSDSGIVWGSVGNANSGSLLRGAPILFGWFDMRKDGKSLKFEEVRTEVASDSTGYYFACGLPTDVAIAAKALGDSAASGEVQFQLGERMSFRVDLRVSHDLAGQMDLLLNRIDRNAKRPTGSSILQGTVVDDRGVAVRDALVAVGTADTVVRTNARGAYSVAGLPAGTLGVNVRGLGYSNATRSVELRPDSATVANFVLSQATTLATFNVRTERRMSIAEVEFNERRKTSTGGFVIETKNRGYAEALGPLRNIPRVTVSQSAGLGPVITMMRPGNGRTCIPLVYLDGALISASTTATGRVADTLSAAVLAAPSNGGTNPASEGVRETAATAGNILMSVNINDITIVEVYNNWIQVPPRYLNGMSQNPCGVVLYWTKNTIPR